MTRTGRPRLDNHHGTIAGYRTYGCKCDDCRAAHRRAVTDWRIRSRASARKATKDQPAIRQTIPAPPVADHLAELRATGWTWAAIARDTGIGEATIARIANGDRQRVLRRVGTALLAVAPLPDLTDYIDPVTVDRLVHGGDWQALNASRAERIAAAEAAWALWGPIRRAEGAAGIAEQAKSGESLTGIERRLGLRAGRDFNRRRAAA